jgi:hypothetical protein
MLGDRRGTLPRSLLPAESPLRHKGRPRLEAGWPVRPQNKLNPVLWEFRMLNSILIALAVFALYALAVRAIFYHKSMIYPTHEHPFQYWWNRLVHHKG